MSISYQHENSFVVDTTALMMNIDDGGKRKETDIIVPNPSEPGRKKRFMWMLFGAVAAMTTTTTTVGLVAIKYSSGSSSSSSSSSSSGSGGDFLRLSSTVTGYSAAGDTTAPATITTTPFLMAHDAGMVYLPPSIKGCGTHKTQALLWNDATKDFVMGRQHSRYDSNDSPLTALLDCGARALDMRLKSTYSTSHCTTGPTDLPAGKLYMYHGDNSICSTTFDEQLPSIIEWSKNNPNEWVFLKIDTDGDSTADYLVEDLFRRYDITLLNNNKNGNNCGGGWSIDDTSKRGLVGYTKGCSDDNFDRSIGYCRVDSRSYPSLQDYIYHSQEKAKQHAALAASEQKFFETQLLWQQNAMSQYGCLQSYDVLQLDHQSKLSERVAEMLNPTSSRSPYLFETRDDTPGTYNMIKMNNICEHGSEIAKAIGTTITKEQQDRCYHYCGGSNTYNDCGGTSH